jgi:glucosamine--fructose-6-phosphate aminotransferase (isomerizing)
MCGIIGYVGRREATGILLDGLKRLEYRGYDSAGIAVHGEDGVVIRRSEGKLCRLEELINKDPPKGRVGIGHTRWATHGRPSETNAHPHRSGNIIVVHNGIIENHAELKKFLMKSGHEFSSDTDTEVACHLIRYHTERGETTINAIRLTLKEIRGSYALVIMDTREKDRLYIAKRGNPLVAGFGEKENFIASDIPALLPYTKKVLFIEDGEFGVLTAGSLEIFSENGVSVKRDPQKIPWNPLMTEKGGFKHFMLKEIFEQPTAIEDNFTGRLMPSAGKVVLDELEGLFTKSGFPFNEISIVACGTSWHAGMVGKYYIEALTRIPVNVDLASEYRYREPIVGKKTLVIPISQSGETADTLAAVQLVKGMGAKVLSICNVVGSSITRASHATLYTHAGPEIGVASTKAFTSQLTALLMFALYVAWREKKIDRKFLCERIDEMMKIPRQMKVILEKAGCLKKIAESVLNVPNAIFIARGVNYPVALEGALKLKEISYVHAEGFAAGELKHGPIALVDRGVPVVAIAAKDATYEKVLSNIEEVRARGARVIAITSNGDRQAAEKSEHIISIPRASWFVTPILASIPLQLLAYYVADYKGTDVDQPRNLAKSVTVE